MLTRVIDAISEPIFIFHFMRILEICHSSTQNCVFTSFLAINLKTVADDWIFFDALENAFFPSLSKYVSYIVFCHLNQQEATQLELLRPNT